MDKEKIVDFIMGDEETVNDMIDFYNDHITIAINAEQLKDNLNRLPEYLLGSIVAGSYGDTMEREEICEAHAHALTGMSWPTYGDGQEAGEAFKKKLDDAHKELGYKVVE